MQVFLSIPAGIVYLFLGLILVYTVRRRRFYRRGPGGLQHYNTFLGSIFWRLIEFIAMLAGIALILFGVMVLIEHYDYRAKKKSKHAVKETKTASYNQTDAEIQTTANGIIFS